MKITNLTLEATHLDTVIEFYQNTLGLPLIHQTEKEVTFRAGATELTFKKTENSVAPYHFAFNIATNHLAQAIVWAKENSIELLPSPKNEIITHFDTWLAQSIYFWDKNGNLLEFIAREDVQLEKEVAFIPSEILNISEIGLVVENPIQTAEAINAQIGTVFFDKTTPLPEFCAIGDDEGLLVLVSPIRNWYPTQQLAHKSAATIQIEVNKNSHTIQTADWN